MNILRENVPDVFKSFLLSCNKFYGKNIYCCSKLVRRKFLFTFEKLPSLDDWYMNYLVFRHIPHV